MSTSSLIKIMLVDDDPFVRPTLRLVAELEPRFKIVAEASGAEEAWQYLQSNLEIDLALVDIRMRGINGIRLTEKIHTHFPQAAVLILSNEDREEYVRQAKQAGARGYLLKETPWPEIVSTIENIIDKKTDFSESSSRITEKIDDGKSTKQTDLPFGDGNPPIPEQLLSPRELEVLWHIGDGKSTKLIARELGIETRTVEGHRSKIWQKLEIKSPHQLIIIATEYRKRHKKPGGDDG